MRKQDIAQDAKQTSNLGLFLGMVIFSGLGCLFLYEGIRLLFFNIFYGIEFWINLIFGMFALIIGVPFIYMGAVCIKLFRLRRKLKHDLKEKFKNDSHLVK